MPQLLSHFIGDSRVKPYKQELNIPCFLLNERAK